MNSRRRAWRLGAAVVMSIVLAGQPIAGPSAESASGVEVKQAVTFVATADASFDQILASMLESNAPESVAEFLEAQASTSDPLVEELALEDFSDENARSTLEKGAAFAKEFVDTADPEVDPAGEENAEVSPAATWASESSTVNSTLSQTDSIVMTPASIESSGVAGSATNGSYSWRYSNRAYLRKCVLLHCWAPSWLDYRLVTDPGKTTSRTNMQFLGGGDHELTKIKLQSVVLSAGKNTSSASNLWNVPVSGLYQWNGPHASTKGKSFQMYYKLTFYGPGGSAGSMEFRTGKSAMCAEPSPGAYRCKFY